MSREVRNEPILRNIALDKKKHDVDEFKKNGSHGSFHLHSRTNFWFKKDRQVISLLNRMFIVQIEEFSFG